MDFDKISIKSVPYNVKDTKARKQIDDETTARKQADTQLSQQDTQLSQQISELNSRISTIIADGQQTEGNTELIDIRTGADGKVYPTAGDAVRGQIGALSEENAELKDDILNIHDGKELKSLLTKQGYVYGYGTIVETAGTWRYSDFIPIDNFNKIAYTAFGTNKDNIKVNNVSFYTNEKLFVGALMADGDNFEGVYSKAYKIVSNARYMIICDNTKNSASTFLSYNESQVPNNAFKDFAKNIVNCGYVNTAGVVVPATEGRWFYSDLIPTDGYNSIEYTLNVNNAVSAIVLYDSDENVISKLVTDNSQLSLVDGTISISNASYIRLCSYIDKDVNCIGYVSYVHTENPYNEVHYQNLVNKPYDFKRKTALFYGDSITQGFTSGTSITQNGYPKLFSDAVNMNYTNYGVGGSCFSHIYNGVATIVSKITETPIDTLQNADYIFIAGGVNDWQTGVTDKQLISALDTLNNFLTNNNLVDKVIYITPINEGGKKPSVTPKQTLQNVRNIITRKAIEVGASVVQGYLFPFPTTTDDSDYISKMYGDKLHPSELGYRVYAKSLLTALL